MSNKNQKYNKPVKKPLQKTAQAAPKVKVAINPDEPPWLNYVLLGAVLLVTFWCYHFTLSNRFTNWDDGLYIYENSFIKNLSPANLNQILFHDITQNYYHPLTMLSLALNWDFVGMNWDPNKYNFQPYYLTEVILHLLNTALVFILSYSLFSAMVKKGYEKIKYIPYLAALCALWFGIHPMHVESVSWIAERKDVLYLFFYLAGLIFYVKYVNGEKIGWMKYANIIPILLFLWAASIVKGYSVEWNFHATAHINKQLVMGSPFKVSEPLILYVLALLFAIVSFVDFRYKKINVTIFYVGEMFLFSLASKPLAVVFPLSLLAIDVLLKRRIEFKLFLEKIPLFTLSLIFGYIAYIWANEGGSISSFKTFTILQRIVFVGYNYLAYLGKLFDPTHLCSYYPYPEYLEGTKTLPTVYYLMPYFAIALTVGLIAFAYKLGENIFRVMLFGFMFYFFNVMFILQFVSAGPAIMADRYSYAPYVGFVFMLVYFLYLIWDKIPSLKIPVYIVVGVFSCFLAYLCEARTEVWHNTKTLWKDVISKYPAKVDTTYNGSKSQYEIHIHSGGVETAYKNLGNYYVQDIYPPNYDSAYMNYVVLEQIKSHDAGVYSNLGNIWAIRGNINKSLEEYSTSIKYDSNNFDTYLDRGITYSRIGKNDLALEDFNHAYRLDSNNQKLLETRGYMLLYGMKDFAKAAIDYNRLIAIEPSNAAYYKDRALARLNSGQVNGAIDDCNKALSGHPKDKDCLYYLSFAYKTQKNYPLAITYAMKAEECGYKLDEGYLEGLKKMVGKNNQ